MISQPPKQKGFFAKYWGLLLAGGLVAGLLLLGALGVGAYFLLRSDVQANSISFSMDKPELGKPLSAKVELENKGILDADYHAVLMVDGAEAATGDVKLESKDPQTITFDLKGLRAGKHTVSIAGMEMEITVYRPAEFKVTNFTVEPESLMMGETVKVKATVKNSGELPGEFESPLSFNGAELQVLKATVEPGEETVIQAEFTVQDRGQHTFGLEGENRTVTAIAPARIEVTGLKLSNTYPKPKEAITATVTVQNSGDLAGSYTVVLNINGKDAQQQEVTVEPNSTLDVPFKVTQSKAGKYSIKSGDQAQSMRVVVITRPANGTLLVKKANSGWGRLTLTNAYKDKDAVFVLASKSNPKAQLLTVYVRAGKKTSSIKVKDGTYYVYYSTGGQFDSASKRFIADVSYGRFDEPISFKTTRSGYTTYYQTWTISIGVSNGNADAVDLGEGDFPK